MSGVTVVIPTLPERRQLLDRALASVWAQTLQPDAVVVTVAADGEPAASTRDRGLDMVKTDYVAFLDDDDELYPQHLERLLTAITETDADWVYPWFDVAGGEDPFPEFFGKPWDNDRPHQTTVTVLARTAALWDVGGFTGFFDPKLAEDPGVDADGNRAGEEYRLVLRLVEVGATVVHLPERTWRWHHHAHNTSGLPSRRLVRA